MIRLLRSVAGHAMGSPLIIRSELPAAELRRLARRERDGRVAARLIALANGRAGMGPSRISTPSSMAAAMPGTASPQRQAGRFTHQPPNVGEGPNLASTARTGRRRLLRRRLPAERG